MTDETPPVVLHEMLTPHIALVTLNRPEKRNAINPEVAEAMEAIVRSLENDPEVRVVILNSSFDKVFCAGADLSALSSGKARGTETAYGGFAGLVYAPRIKPWIAAVEGVAVAGGCELVLSCDMIVASRTASFGVPEVKRGLLANAGGVHRLLTVLPRNIAYEMIATGDSIDAERAHQYGLVNRLTDAGGALAGARQLAEQIVVNAPLAVQYSLQAARASQGQSDGAARVIVNERFWALRKTEDFLEGPRAFVEKRAAVWKGR